MDISDRVHEVGQELAAAPTDQNLTERLNGLLPQLLGDDFKATTGRIVDLDGKLSATFASIVHRPRAVGSEDEALAADEVAAVFDGMAELTLDRLRDAYARIAEVKSLRKTPVGKEQAQAKTNTTLGLILAARSAVPLETIEAEMASLNLVYASNLWPDMVAIADSAAINYAVQFPGESLTGDYLPPAENATQGGAPAIYVVTVIRPTGTHTFNHMLSFLCAHLGLFGPDANLPDRDAIAAGVTRGAVTYTGYHRPARGESRPSFNLPGTRAALPRSQAAAADHHGHPQREPRHQYGCRSDHRRERRRTDIRRTAAHQL